MHPEENGIQLPEAEQPAPEAEVTEEVAAAEEVPAEEVPVEEAPSEEAPAEEAPSEEAPAEEVPSEEAPAEEVPSEEAPAEEVPPAKQPRKKRHIAVRILCGFLGVLLVLLMFVSALTGLTVANLQNITRQKVISQILSGILTSAPVESPFPVLSMPLTVGVTDMDPGGIDINDITGENSTDFVVDFVYDMVKKQYGDKLAVTKEDMSAFLEESTAKEFVVEKVSGLVSDMVNGTNKTTITIDEIQTLVQENAPLLEEHFDIVITADQTEQLNQIIQDTGILQVVEEKGLLGIIEQAGGAAAPDADAPGSSDSTTGTDGSDGSLGGMSSMMETVNMIKEALETFRQIASVQNLLICIAVFLLLSVALFFCNDRGIPGTLVGMGIPLLLVGGIYSAPSIVCVSDPDTIISLLSGMMDGGAMVGKAVITVFTVIMPLNISVLVVGALMIVASIVLKIIFSQKNKKQVVPAA